jgi:predicted flavoprotein YhiN
MKFDPSYFIKIANRSGVELTLKDDGRVHFESIGSDNDLLFLMTAKKHKRKLLSHMKIEQKNHNQFDLFNTPPL